MIDDNPHAPAFPSLSIALPIEDSARVEATLYSMGAVAIHAARQHPVRVLAEAITADARNAGHTPVRHLWDFLRSHITFERDPFDVELVRHPVDIIASIVAQGGAAVDCDDLATLAAALMLAMGVPPRSVAFAVIAREGAGRWEHVHYAFIPPVPGAKPIPYDPQETKAPGKWHAGTYHKLIFPLSKVKP